MNHINTQFTPKETFDEFQIVTSELIHIEKPWFGEEVSVNVMPLDKVIENAKNFDESCKFYRTIRLTIEDLNLVIQRKLEEKISKAIQYGCVRFDLSVDMPNLVAVFENGVDSPPFYQFKFYKEHQRPTTLDRILEISSRNTKEK